MVVIWLPSTNQFDFNFRCSMSPRQVSCNTSTFLSRVWFLLLLVLARIPGSSSAQPAGTLPLSCGLQDCDITVGSSACFHAEFEIWEFLFRSVFKWKRISVCFEQRTELSFSWQIQLQLRTILFSFVSLFFLFTYLSFFLQPWRSRPCPQPAGPTGSDFSPQ